MRQAINNVFAVSGDIAKLTHDYQIKDKDTKDLVNKRLQGAPDRDRQWEEGEGGKEERQLLIL